MTKGKHKLTKKSKNFEKISCQYLIHSTQLMNTWNKMEQFPVANWKMSERKSLEIAYVQAPT